VHRDDAPALAIRVLGAVEAIGPFGTLAPDGAGAVLAVLVVHALGCVPVDRLVDELWSAESAESGAPGAKRVQVNVLRLRRALVRTAPDVNAARSCGRARAAMRCRSSLTRSTPCASSA
jgi:DNA-binding SARP family transcriptional activator